MVGYLFSAERGEQLSQILRNSDLDPRGKRTVHFSGEYFVQRENSAIERNYSDFPCNPTMLLFSATHFAYKKEEKMSRFSLI